MEVFGWLPRGSLTTFCLLIVCMLLLLATEAHIQSDEVVCKSIDIRNSVTNFRKLENCTVIEGFLQILLIDKAMPEEYENLSFPALKEITGYLLLYRAKGMTSVGKLFPNLVVIRGGVLFHNFALVIYEMSSLQEIGLHSLTAILRGSVRIEKNMDLCYVETIDWGSITEAGAEGNYIRNNRDRNQCPDTCMSSCPKNPHCPHGKGPVVGDRSCLLCWGPHKCQKLCKQFCGSNDRGLTCTPGVNYCCSRECLGGCNGTKTTDCLACKHFIFEGKCLESCPEGTYKYMGRRCIAEATCKNMTDTVNRVGQMQVRYYKPFNGTCLTSCPAGFTDNGRDKHACDKCPSKCPKSCAAALVDSVESAERLKGCTTIDGSLEIQIQGGRNIVIELEENLKDIQEIKGFLKIARSTPLISLTFLKSLRYIRGDILDREHFALLVLDNENLQDLWDWKSRNVTLEITKGRVFFHFNGKLCPEKINALKNTSYCKVNDWDNADVSERSNGYRVPCSVHTLEVRVIKKSSNIAVISWKSFRQKVIDHRHLLNYVVYHKEAPHMNVTIYDGRDACSSDVWNVKDVDVEKKDSKQVEHLITDLRPFTQYAYYVKAYMTTLAEKGAQSPIQYFKTNASTPSSPVKLMARAVDPNKVYVSWKPPKHPNGVITNYTVVVIEKLDVPEIVFQRNYCDEGQITVDYKQKEVSSDHPKLNTSKQEPSGSGSSPTLSSDIMSGVVGKQCCACEETKKKPSPGEKVEDMENQIMFEDFLHNAVFIRNPSFVLSEENGGRSRRSIMSESTKTANDPDAYSANDTSTEYPLTSTMPTVNESIRANSYRVKNVSGSEEKMFVDNLRHFTEYAIEVKACQSVDPFPPSEMGCSLNAITTVRTMALGGADDIPDGSIILRTENKSIGSIYVKWDEPKDPNGLIVSYQIEYRMAAEQTKPIVDCITGLQFKEARGHRLTKLNPGNYSLRIRATSLAWSGNWTLPVYFVVPAMPNDSNMDMLWIIIPVVLLVGLVFPAGGYYFFKRRFGMGVPDGILYASVNPEYMSAGLVYEPDEWEIPREKIAMIRELGQGSFGMVYEGEAKDVQGKSFLKCAVKTVNESASVRERIEFLQEASVMKAFNCFHVVKLLGVVSKGHPTLVVMELMARGDLKSYLRSHRPDEIENSGREPPPSLKQIYQMAGEIADGMAYLAAKKFVHRDLAARNCMVAEDLTVKIGDFGMTRDIYETDYYRKGGKGLLPVRWMAPESLKDGIFTSQSDVWSYGVVLWEMATLASQPYQGLSNEQVLKYVISGGLMECPENCPERLYALMKMCWNKNPRTRPTFSEIIEVLLKEVNQRFREVSFYFTERPKMIASKDEETSLEVVTSSTPLKSPSAQDSSSVNGRDNSDEDELESVQYFPNSSTAFTNGSDIVQCSGDVHLLDEGPSSTAHLDLNLGANGRRPGYSNNEGSKGMSLPSSDGSKGSKVSSVSNGSLVNGHATVPFPSARTTTC